MEKPEQKDQRNSLVYDPDQEALVITIYLGVPSAVCMGLGSLEVAKDQLKLIAAQRLQQKAKQAPGLIVPGNGNGGLHAL